LRTIDAKGASKMEKLLKFANANRIRTIDFARSGIEGTGTMSPRARRTLAVYVVLIKMGFAGVFAPMGAIADAIYRSSHGESGSIRTLQRAHRELEQRGYIRCAVYRPGQRARGTVVSFCPEAFSFWTKIPAKNVTPLPTQSHLSPDATTCRPPDRTRDKVCPNSLDSLEKVNTEPHAGARANNRSLSLQDKKKKHKKNPVLFSVDKALEKMTSRTHRADRTAARARARCEVAALAAGIALVNPSGIDWAYWDSRWSDLSVPVREATAAREIVPLLLGNRCPVEQLGALEDQMPQTQSSSSIKPPTAAEIREMREQLESKLSLDDQAPAPDGARKYPDVDESDPDMKILVQARDRVRAAIGL
jgi:hypothetical protein